MTLILHITDSEAWKIAASTGRYHHASLATEGFIHCSRPDQVVWVANTFFAGQRGLVLLCIDSDCLQADWRNDPVEPDQFFPHVYGEINVDAVVQIIPFEPNDQGQFSLPAALANHVSADITS